MHYKYLLILYLFIFVLGCNNGIRVNDKNEQSTTIITDEDIALSENYKGIQTCEEGETLAKVELKAGKIRYIFSNYGSRQKLPRQLEKLYNIEIIDVKGVLGQPNNCYNDIMYKEIQKRFGRDAFNKALLIQK